MLLRGPIKKVAGYVGQFVAQSQSFRATYICDMSIIAPLAAILMLLDIAPNGNFGAHLGKVVDANMDRVFVWRDECLAFVLRRPLITARKADARDTFLVADQGPHAAKRPARKLTAGTTGLARRIVVTLNHLRLYRLRMSEGEKAATGNLVRSWSATHRRPIWTGLAIAGAGGAGFSAAVLAGVSPTFGQPLATLLGGAGVLAAGTLAYLTGQRSRAQAEAHHRIDSRHERESALRDRYTAIATQIADKSAAIRQAGVYALTALADDWHAFGEDDERQVCINLLQWYLRVPFPVGDDPEKPDLSEREIRQTIAAILIERRRRPSGHPKSWATTVISLHQASLPNCTFRNNDLATLDLTRAHLLGVDLAFANLTGADLTNANLTGANLIHANLINANLIEADLTDANLSGADLTGADLEEADLTDANLSGSNLIDANLTDAKLTSANLIRANLIRAYLERANLIDADLSGADLSGAQLIDAASTANVKYDETTRWPEGFPPPPA
ncbi:pentapeptide repeat-containing protein [Nocardia brasiliensis]|uniref:pentapeptide repeat-containing protein n=1 Tax=Nocardia brasiliensis TaxID=37326 RepID=UPI00366B68A4